MPRTLIDVTQLIEWQGRLTGIPRVMYELSVRFAAEEDVRFLAWDSAGQGFLEVGLEAITGREQAMPAEAQAADIPPQGNTLRTLLHKAETRSSLVRHAARYPRALKRRLKKPLAAAPTVPAFQPEAGDTLLVLWGSWFDEPYMQAIVGYRANGVRLVQIAYDMLPILTPQYSGHSTDAMTKYCTTVYPACDLILAISHHTCDDIKAWLKAQKLRLPPLAAFRLGDDFAFSAPKRPQGAFHGAGLKGGDYALCVGTVEARKNHALLYYAYKLAKHRGIRLPKVVVVGRRGWMTDDLYAAITTDPETKDSFVFLHGASDEELSWLYEHCQYSIYPSLYEGWGLPVAESVARGVPCIASNASSIPEIAGDLIPYFSPVSTDECLAAMAALQTPAALEKARRQLKKYRPTTWEQTFAEVKTHLKRNKP